jgi:protein gp37
MTKMFKSVTETWNPMTGCLHSCTYCYARKKACGRLRTRYCSNLMIPLPIFLPYSMTYGGEKSDGYSPIADPFYPRWWPGRLKKTFKPGGLVFVCDMGDIMGAWWPTDWIQAVLDRIALFPQTDFLLCSKNPERYLDFIFPPNVILGTTFETNRLTWEYSWAAPPEVRQVCLHVVPHPRKFVSIEPIMDFDLDVLHDWIKEIRPEIVEVGADNYGYGLPEPTGAKIRLLLYLLKGIVPKVVEKDGLGRLLK